MSQSPLEAEGSKDYADAWRAINVLIRGDGSWSGRERNLCFRNRGDGTFADISFLSGLDLDADGRAFVPLDIDADGDLDLIVKNRNGRQLRAFRNEMPDRRSRHLSVALSGRESNRDGVGGRIWIQTDRRTLMREIVSGSGYLSQRSRAGWFGLAPDEVVRSVRVRWPLGRIQQIERPPQSGDYYLVEGESRLRRMDTPAPRPVESESAGALPAEATAGTWLAQPLPAPDFELPVVGDREATMRLSGQHGTPVLLNFWATWCPPCRKELASFQEGLSALTGAGVKVVAVSVDESSNSESVAALVNELGLEYPALVADAETAEAYSVLNERLFDRRRALAIPTSFLLDEDGRILKVYRGLVDPAAVVSDALAGQGSALPFAGHWAVSQPKRDYQELASALAERGLGRPARQMFDAALAQGGRSPMLLNNLAGILIAEGEHDRGEQLLREALVMAPDLSDAKVNLAALLLGRGDPYEAERLLDEALASQPRDAQALSSLGSIRFSQGRLPEAEGLFRRAAESRPDDLRHRENLGAALASQGRYDAAITQYEEARRLGSASEALHTNLGVLYMQAGRPDDGLDAFLAAVEANPAAPGPHLNLALYRLQMGQADQAMQSIRRAREASPTDLGALLMEARALAEQGELEGAAAAAQEAVRLHPDSADARELLDSLR